jgi:hypothetical protein
VTSKRRLRSDGEDGSGGEVGKEEGDEEEGISWVPTELTSSSATSQRRSPMQRSGPPTPRMFLLSPLYGNDCGPALWPISSHLIIGQAAGASLQSKLKATCRKRVWIWFGLASISLCRLAHGSESNQPMGFIPFQNTIKPRNILLLLQV